MQPPQLNSNRHSSRRRRKPKARRSQSMVRMRSKTEVEKEAKKSSCGCYFFILILLGGLGFYTYKKRDQWHLTHYFDEYFKPKRELEVFVPDPVAYEQLKAQLAADKQELKMRFMNANTAQEQNEIINEACALLEHMMPKMMRCWLGHEWDFNGTATIPGKGKIACGYYVSVIMRDAGFKVNRIRLAQQPSQRILKTFLPQKRDLWITGGMPYDEYAGKIKSGYEGISIVGLDNHVAFVVVQNGTMRFIHSGGLQKLVVDEAKPDAYSLKVSNYRVIGNITRNHDLLRKWILDDPFETAR